MGMKEKNSPEKNNRRNFYFFWFLLVALLGGLSGGAAAVIIAGFCLPQNINNFPISQGNNSSPDSLRQANSIIESAKKIIAGQADKINDSISGSRDSLVGVFKKNEAAAINNSPSSDNPFKISAYYKLDEAVGEGVAVTSDGWVLASNFTKDLLAGAAIKNYVVITNSKDVYNIDRIAPTGIDSYIFLHLSQAKDLPVKSFVSKADLNNSQSLVAMNWQGESYLTSIVDKAELSQAVKDSDNGSRNIVFADNLSDYFDNAFVFTLDSQVVAYFDKKNGSFLLYNFQPLIKGLLQGRSAKRPSLGVSYVNLAEYAIKDFAYSKGALLQAAGKAPAVKPGSAAASAGLKEGDVIVAVDNTELDVAHDLGNVLEKYSAGDEINLIYRRGGTENAVKVKLGELK
jgi:hypothetical protein